MAPLAEQLAVFLDEQGVRFVFAVPGGPSIPYMEAMRKKGIKFTLVSNEQSAAIMADVCARLTGVPGVCHATFGPGATNLSTGVGGALLDRSPLIAFTTEVKDADIGRKVQMNIDHQALYKPLTKWTVRLSAQNFHETLTRAFELAASEVPGPVHIGLPSNIDQEQVIVEEFVRLPIKKSLPAPDPAELNAAQQLFEKAKKPLIAVGLTAARLGLQQSVREFAAAKKIPVVLTPMAKGIVPEEHPCYAGVIFHARSDIVAEVYRQSDLIIGVGYDPIEFNYESWLPRAPLIHIDTEAADITADYEEVCNVIGDPAASLAHLHALKTPVYDWDWAEVNETKKRLYDALFPLSFGFSPSELIVALREMLPAEGIITGDVGAHLHLLGQLWKTPEPNRFIMTNGWSMMGFGIPSAIAAKLCRPEVPVVCLIGDGGFLMNCGELMTARRLGLNVIIIVMCDKSLSLIEVKQGWKDVVCCGTDLYEGEYFGAERFLDVPVFKAADVQGFRAAFVKAQALSGPAIIEAVIDGSVYKDLMTRSFK